MKMNIRSATGEDLAAIQQCMDALSQHREAHYRQETKQFHLRRHPETPVTQGDLINGLCFIAEDADGIVGCIMGSMGERKNYHHKVLGHIDALFVAETQRGKKVASRLLERLEEAFRAKGCDHMITHTDHENTAAQQCYQVNGMVPVTVELWKPLKAREKN